MIEIRNLNLSLRGNIILENINLAIHPAQVCALIGENGAGKTSTIRCMAGLYPPTTGACMIFGEPAYNMSQKSRNRMGMVFDGGGLYGEMSAWENVQFFARLRGVEKDRIRERYNRLVQQFELRTSLKVERFSKGMKQKLMIIRELVHEPELLILDEPFNGLDPDSKIFLRNKLRELCSEQGTSILISSHELFDLEKIADQVIMIHQGQIAANHAIQEITETDERYIVICSNPEHAKSILKNMDGMMMLSHAGQSVRFVVQSEVIKQPLQLLIQHGVEVQEFFKEKNSLEDFYKATKQAVIRHET
ncbi:ABC transporter ATP-binding protein [Paenibacillus barcinonensis]|uniref:ABC transporter ATP-binding protein n=1 Tax=Paenibacillus barcinonensis TaxID=198119 RepID=UPI001C12380A|nr:ABC transporter ATP-binding protein [Paenibacillus barcinonensis]MBU5351283.1 ABC transporter ATP-binding protein [Paenibacillus barcinonensis]